MLNVIKCFNMLYYCVFTGFAGLSRECRIQRGSVPAVGTPTFEGRSQTTYSCFADAHNCNYDVHVIGNYEGNGHTGFRVHNTGNTNVRINVRGQMYRPLVLVFVSYEPVNWILSLSSGVTIEKVLLVSFYSHQAIMIVMKDFDSNLYRGRTIWMTLT